MCNKAFADWHCNAHSNNLVLLPERAGAAAAPPRLLAMLDVDMAFDGASFVDVGSGATGLPAARLAALLEFERWQMLSVLAGADSTSGLPRDMKPAVTELYLARPRLRRARSALVDTLLLGYLAGLAGDAAAVPAHDARLHAAAHAYARLAVAVMANYAC